MKDLSMHIMDILQNSTRAKATEITLEVLEDSVQDTLTLVFKDNGCGMDEETVQKVINPFFTTRTTRKVGLGLPLLKQNTEQTGGSLKIESKVGVGTTVTAVFGSPSRPIPISASSSTTNVTMRWTTPSTPTRFMRSLTGCLSMIPTLSPL